MRLVRAAVDGLRAGRGGFLQVVGEPGIGKTFLLAAARELASAAGIGVISGRASEFERQMPFHLIREALQDYGDVMALSREMPAAFAELRSAVLGLRQSGTVGPADRDSDRLRLFRGLRQLLIGRARTPLVMLLDDVPGTKHAFVDPLTRCAPDTPGWNPDARHVEGMSARWAGRLQKTGRLAAVSALKRPARVAVGGRCTGSEAGYGRQHHLALLRARR